MNKDKLFMVKVCVMDDTIHNAYNAVKYEQLGYTTDKTLVEKLSKEVIGEKAATCWAADESLPKYKIQEVPELPKELRL